jgi:Holliday junction resolvase RusA-like endonuclease
MATIRLTGNPIAKKRPRFFRKGKHVGAFNAQETEEGRAAMEIQRQWGKGPTAKPVSVSIYAYIARPKSHFGTGKNAKKLKPSAPRHPLSCRMDIDNIVKFYLDCMNIVVFNDDSQVVSLLAEKLYVPELDPTPEVEIHIEEVE